MSCVELAMMLGSNVPIATAGIHGQHKKGTVYRGLSQFRDESRIAVSPPPGKYGWPDIQAHLQSHFVSSYSS
jgi:hypothetical protein